MDRPMPMPSTNMNSELTTMLVCSSIRDNKYSPAPVKTEPRIGKILYLPVLLTSVPLMIDVSSRPTTSGSMRRPDVVAEVPSTYCRNVGM